MNTFEFTENFAFCMAHHLPNFPDGHKCRNVHGHTCVLTITVRVGTTEVLDHADIRAVVTPIVKRLCHAGIINDVDPGLADGTAEAQLVWFWPLVSAAVSALGCELVDLEHAEGSAPDGVLMWHRKRYREPCAEVMT